MYVSNKFTICAEVWGRCGTESWGMSKSTWWGGWEIIHRHGFPEREDAPDLVSQYTHVSVITAHTKGIVPPSSPDFSLKFDQVGWKPPTCQFKSAKSVYDFDLNWLTEYFALVETSESEAGKMPVLSDEKYYFVLYKSQDYTCRKTTTERITWWGW